MGVLVNKISILYILGFWDSVLIGVLVICMPFLLVFMLVLVGAILNKDGKEFGAGFAVISIFLTPIGLLYYFNHISDGIYMANIDKISGMTIGKDTEEGKDLRFAKTKEEIILDGLTFKLNKSQSNILVKTYTLQKDKMTFAQFMHNTIWKSLQKDSISQSIWKRFTNLDKVNIYNDSKEKLRASLLGYVKIYDNKGEQKISVNVKN